MNSCWVFDNWAIPGWAGLYRNMALLPDSDWKLILLNKQPVVVARNFVWILKVQGVLPHACRGTVDHCGVCTPCSHSMCTSGQFTCAELRTATSELPQIPKVAGLCTFILVSGCIHMLIFRLRVVCKIMHGKFCRWTWRQITFKCFLTSPFPKDISCCYWLLMSLSGLLQWYLLLVRAVKPSCVYIFVGPGWL